MVNVGQEFSFVVGAAIVLLALFVLAALVPFRRHRQVEEPKKLARLVRWTTAAALVALLVGGLAIPVFLAAAVLNLTLGASERVPFSVYAMFSRPTPVATSLRLVRANDEEFIVKLMFGRSANDVVKRYHHELRVAGGDSADVSADLGPERAAAAQLADFLIEGRRSRGNRTPLPEVRIELVEFRLDGDRFDRRTHQLATISEP